MNPATEAFATACCEHAMRVAAKQVNQHGDVPTDALVEALRTKATEAINDLLTDKDVREALNTPSATHQLETYLQLRMTRVGIEAYRQAKQEVAS